MASYYCNTDYLNTALEELLQLQHKMQTYFEQMEEMILEMEIAGCSELNIKLMIEEKRKLESIEFSNCYHVLKAVYKEYIETEKVISKLL